MIKKTTKQKKRKPTKIDVEHILLQHRHIFLYDTIDDKQAAHLTKRIIALDEVSHKEPIVMYINSPGGSVDSGFSIIDTMRTVRAPVLTIVNGTACSMAGVISVVGVKRLITKNSWWMGHDMAVYIDDYFGKVKSRAEYFEKLSDQFVKHFQQYTKLKLEDLNKMQDKELWLSPKECVKKGVADAIL